VVDAGTSLNLISPHVVTPLPHRLSKLAQNRMTVLGRSPASPTSFTVKRPVLPPHPRLSSGTAGLFGLFCAFS
jgi:hypothetical protein